MGEAEVSSKPRTYLVSGDKVIFSMALGAHDPKTKTKTKREFEKVHEAASRRVIRRIMAT
jgi:hypothetical protein